MFFMQPFIFQFIWFQPNEIIANKVLVLTPSIWQCPARCRFSRENLFRTESKRKKSITKKDILKWKWETDLGKLHHTNLHPHEHGQLYSYKQCVAAAYPINPWK